jgi:hypothetical protein
MAIDAQWLVSVPLSLTTYLTHFARNRAYCGTLLRDQITWVESVLMSNAGSSGVALPHKHWVRS